MVEAPETRYVKSGNVEIAYQVCGQGDPWLIYYPGARFPIDLVWDERHSRHFLQRLATFSRVVLFDPRGWAASATTSTSKVPTAEDWADDIGRVMEAVGAERAALLGSGEGAFGSLYFAAAHPELISAMVLVNGFARYRRAEDYGPGMPAPIFEMFAEGTERQYGTGQNADLLAPTLAVDPEFGQWWGRCERLSTTPSIVRRYWTDLMSRDLRPAVPALRVPTHVVHRAGDRYVRVDHGRYLAEHIPGASYAELDGDDHIVFAGDADAMLDEIETFFTGARPDPRTDRMLATVLFTDIVDSTRRAVEMGDRAWRQLLDRHDEMVTALVRRYRGRIVKSTGDGALATFDGPSRAIECAVTLRSEARRAGVELRAGLHAGEIELRGEDIGGIAVHVAARVEAVGRPGDVLVSRTVTDLVSGSGIAFDDRGEHELKGVPGQWRLFAVRADRPVS